MALTTDGNTVNIPVAEFDDNELIDTITIQQFDYDEKTIAFREPVAFPVTYDAETKMLKVEYPSLAVLIFAETLDELRDMLSFDLSATWSWVVDAPDEMLEQSAIVVKRNFLELTH